MIYFVYNVIQTSCFFFPEKVNNLYEQSSLCVWPAVGAYQNPDYYYQGSTLRLYRLHLALSFLPLRLKLLQQLQLCDQFSPKLQ